MVPPGFAESKISHSTVHFNLREENQGGGRLEGESYPPPSRSPVMPQARAKSMEKTNFRAKRALTPKPNFIFRKLNRTSAGHFAGKRSPISRRQGLERYTEEKMAKLGTGPLYYDGAPIER